MTTKKILELYNEVNNLKPTSLDLYIEERLDLLLNKYNNQLQDSFEKLKNYDCLDLIREVISGTKFN